MSNQIDNLFKKKLEGHTVTPDVSVWSKISSGTSKKNKAVIWFRAAAALLLMVSAFWLYFNTNNSPSPKMAEVKPAELKIEKSEIAQQETKEIKTEEVVNEPQTPTVVTQEPRVLLAKKNKVEPRNKNNESNDQTIDIVTEPLESIAKIDLIPIQDDNEVNATSKPIVIVYELKSYTKKTEPESELEPILQKKNSLKKVLDVANNIRTGESPLGGLRQAKEDLFALNFKKEDKKNNR